MSNILVIDTNSIENIKTNINKMELFVDNIDNKLSQCNSVRDLRIEDDNIATLKKEITQNIDNLKNISDNLTIFTNNAIEINDNISKSLINLRNTYKKINTK